MIHAKHMARRKTIGRAFIEKAIKTVVISPLAILFNISSTSETGLCVLRFYQKGQVILKIFARNSQLINLHWDRFTIF